MTNPWDDDIDDFDDVIECDQGSLNHYLSDAETGLEMVRRLLERTPGTVGIVDEIYALIDRRLMPMLPNLKYAQSDVLELLINVKNRITELHKASILKQRAVLGVGGKFSAGKSCFINSITDAGLPEGQRATTSIATYIVKSDRPGNLAVTSRDLSVDLDNEAVEALTHEFSRLYGIGFVRFIDNLIIRSATFRYPEIAILDTPGYSKADSGKNADASDAEIAMRQLGSVDALVWLMDIENGVINETDLKFIESLKSAAKILFIFNKADLRPLDTVSEIVNQTKAILLDRPEFEQRIFDVIGYSSRNCETVVGGDALERFLTYVCSLASNKRSLEEMLEEAQKIAENDILSQQKELKENEVRCDQVISNVLSPDRISSLVELMAFSRERKWRLGKINEELKAIFLLLKKQVVKLLNQREEEKFTVHVKLPDSWKHCRLKSLIFESCGSEQDVCSASTFRERMMIQRLDEWYTEEIPVSVRDIIISSNSDPDKHTGRIQVSPENSWVSVNEDLTFVVQGSRENFNE